MVHLYHTIQQWRKQTTDVWNNLDESSENYAEWERQSLKSYE